MALYTRENLDATSNNLNTPLKAVAVRLGTPITATICLLYLPDGRRYDVDGVRDLINQLPLPIIIFGYFITHHIPGDLKGPLLKDTYYPACLRS